MKSFETTTSIVARPEANWALLTDAAGDPSWSTTVDRVDGTIAPNEAVALDAKVNRAGHSR